MQRIFGVPQNRERLIYIGNCLGIDNEKIFNEIFELSEKIPEYNLGDALFGLRKLEASRVKTLQKAVDRKWIQNRKELLY